ncbi:MAG: hypothetical protein ACYTG4_01455, partial [Planctomycetota bacterium]
EPPGAMVRVNGVPAGPSPVEIPFTWYGTVRLETDALDTDNDGLADFRPTVMPLDLVTPWYEWFPLDFFSENLVPWTIVDEHETLVVLEPSAALDDRGVDALREKAADVLQRAEKRRAAGPGKGGDEPEGK